MRKNKKSEIFGESTVIETEAFATCKALESVKVSGILQKVGKKTFAKCSALKEISFASPLDEIESSAFDGCASLERIELKSPVKKVGDKAFIGCNNLKKVYIDGAEFPLSEPDEAVSVLAGKKPVAAVIPEGAVEGCQIQNETLVKVFVQPDNPHIAIPDNVTVIAEDAFSQAQNIETIHIGRGIKKIPDNLISLPKLRLFTVSEDNDVFQSNDGVLFSKGMNAIICYPKGKTEEEYVIPQGVTEIGERAFADCKTLTSIVFPKGIDKISLNDRAFSGSTNLKRISVDLNTKLEASWIVSFNPNTVAHPFKNCKELKTLAYYGEFGNFTVPCTAKTLLDRNKSVLEAIEYLKKKEFEEFFVDDDLIMLIPANISKQIFAAYYGATKDPDATPFVQENLAKLMAKAIADGNLAFVQAAIEKGMLTKKNITKFITAAKNQPEILAVFEEYKAKL